LLRAWQTLSEPFAISNLVRRGALKFGSWLIMSIRKIASLLCPKSGTADGVSRTQVGGWSVLLVECCVHQRNGLALTFSTWSFSACPRITLVSASFSMGMHSSSIPMSPFPYLTAATPLTQGSAKFCTMASQIPAEPGAYLLLIELTKATDVRLANRRSASLLPGCYLYAGSAYGSGGLKARVARHMRRAKLQWWHIDQLTKNGVPGAWIFPGCNECDLVAMNSALPVPIVGFGSTGCKRCRSHLLGPIRGTPPN
jgi:Uri superfamily endonuclease